MNSSKEQKKMVRLVFKPGECYTLKGNRFGQITPMDFFQEVNLVSNL